MTQTAFGPQGPNYTTTRPPYDPVVSGGVDTWFKNCSAAGATDGTYATADFFNVVVANLRDAIEAGNIPLDGTNDQMLAEAIRAIALQVVNGNAPVGARGIQVVSPTANTPLTVESTLGLSLRPPPNLSPTNDLLDIFSNGAVSEISPFNLLVGTLLAGSNISLTHDVATGKLAISSTGDGSGGGGGSGSGSGGSGIANPSIQLITQSGTYVPSSGKSSAIAIVTGGGGGGAGGSNSFSTAGGSAGATAIKAFSLQGITSLPVTVGGGGAGGAGVTGLAALGGTGGSTSLGGLASAGGGSGQQTGGGTTYRGTAPGPGGVATEGDVLISGGTGSSDFAPTDTYNFVGASGGASFWGGGGAGSFFNPYSSSNAGQDGQAYGSGGGGSSGALGSSATGGNGAPGVIVIFEFD